MKGGRFVALVIVVAFLVVVPFFLRPYGIYLISLWAVTAIAASGLNLTLGYAGQVSLAQGAFVGIGAYTEALLAQNGVPYPVAFLAAGALTFGIGWGLGYPALRVQHHYLAFVTLAFSTLVFLVLRNEQWLTNGIYGISGIMRPRFAGWSTGRPFDFYFFCLGVLAVLSLATWWMLRSPWGRAFVALRENPIRALSLGLDTRRYTLMAFAIGSALGGMSGAVYAPLVQFIEPNSFALAMSLSLLLMVIVGGSGTFCGPYVGAMVAVLLPEWLRSNWLPGPWLIPDALRTELMRFIENGYLMLYAALVMVLMAFCPSGILGLVDRLARAMRRRKPGNAGLGAPGPAS
jgi:branched-chain amino acid transport system permease protein